MLERDKIANEYAKAVTDKKRGAVQATANAKFAGYDDEVFTNLPEGMMETSFGCGDPLSFSEIKAGETVLDIGCGAGLDLLLAAEKVGPKGRVIGIDMTEEMLDKARKNIAASGYANIELRKGIIEAMPIEDGSVDWVISNCVINLSPEKERVFAEVARVLKPGGKMLVSDMVAEKLPVWIRMSKSLTAACGGGAISETNYLAGLNNAGLEQSAIVGRLHYDADQMAGVAVDMLPKFVANVKCCGKSVAQSVLKRVAQPITQKLWSARIYAVKSMPA